MSYLPWTCGLLLICILISCRKENATPPHAIRWLQLAEGQTARYAFALGQNFRQPDDLLTPLGDTVVVTVKGQDANGWLVEEQLTKDSRSYRSGGDTSVFRYYWQIEAEQLRVRGVPPESFAQSRLYRGNPVLPLYGIAQPTARKRGWMVDFPTTCEDLCIGALPAQGRKGTPFTVVKDIRDTPFDGPITVHIYEPTRTLYRLIRYAGYSPTRNGYVWTRID